MISFFSSFFSIIGLFFLLFSTQYKSIWAYEHRPSDTELLLCIMCDIYVIFGSHYMTYIYKVLLLLFHLAQPYIYRETWRVCIFRLIYHSQKQETVWWQSQNRPCVSPILADIIDNTIKALYKSLTKFYIPI